MLVRVLCARRWRTGDIQQKVGANGRSGVSVSQAQSVVEATESDIACALLMYDTAKATVRRSTTSVAVPHVSVRRFIYFDFDFLGLHHNGAFRRMVHTALYSVDHDLRVCNHQRHSNLTVLATSCEIPDYNTIHSELVKTGNCQSDVTARFYAVSIKNRSLALGFCAMPTRPLS